MLVPYEGESFKIVPLKLGHMDNFIYVIIDRKTKKAAVVDPAWQVAEVEKALVEYGAELAMVLITHTHYDHVNGVDEILHRHDIPLYIHEDEANFWGRAGEMAVLVKDESLIDLGETSIEVIATPGHTIGGICFRMEDHLISGDSFFVYGCGHCKLKGSDPARLYASVQKIQRVLPAHTIMYPGHDYGIVPTITLQEQIDGNPFFRCKDEADFIDYRMNRHDRSQPYEACDPA